MEPLQIGNLTVKYPIVQGGMGVAISLSGLASAVANAGGIGVISAAGIGMTAPGSAKDLPKANKETLIKEIRTARSKTTGVLGVNLMVALSDYDELLQTAIEEEIDVVFMGAGLPLKLPEKILEKGLSNIHTKFIPKVSSPKAAKLIFQYWGSKFNYIPDAIVLEGPKAGGHLGFKKSELTGKQPELSDLIKDTVAEVKVFELKHNKKVPVIAAGGIYTGEDIQEIMKAGASGVKLGTKFVTTHECDAHIDFKKSYLNSSKNDITLIDSPVGLPGRVIDSEFVHQVKNGETKPFKCPWQCLKSCNYKEVPYCISQVLLNSARGRMGHGFAFAGTNAYRATSIQSVAEVFQELIEGYNIANANSFMVPDICKIAV